MIKRWMIVLAMVALSASLAASPVFGAQAKKKPDDPVIQKWWTRQKIVKKLGLADEQTARIKEIYNREYNQIVEDRWDYRQQKSQMEYLLKQTDLDEDQIGKQTAHVQAARAKLEETILQMQTDMMKELSPEQRRELLTMLKNWRDDPVKKSRSQKKHKNNRGKRSGKF